MSKINYEPQYDVHMYTESLPNQKEAFDSKRENPGAYTSNGVSIDDLQFADQTGLSNCKTNLAKFAFACQQKQSGAIEQAAERFSSAFQPKK